MDGNYQVHDEYGFDKAEENENSKKLEMSSHFGASTADAGNLSQMIGELVRTLNHFAPAQAAVLATAAMPHLNLSNSVEVQDPKKNSSCAPLMLRKGKKRAVSFENHLLKNSGSSDISATKIWSRCPDSRLRWLPSGSPAASASPTFANQAIQA